MGFEELHDDLEIVEQSALDHFNFILQKAQSLAAKQEHVNPRKCPKRYNGKSERSLKRHKKRQEDLAKQGYLLVFEFLAHVTDKTKERALESEQDTEDSESILTSEHVGQVRCKEALMHRY
jgi:hypothetical protein